MGLKCALSAPLLGGGVMLCLLGCSGVGKTIPKATAMKDQGRPSIPWISIAADQVKWRMGLLATRAPGKGPILEWSATSATLAFQGTGLRMELLDLGDSHWEECAGNTLEVIVDDKDTIDHVIDRDAPLLEVGPLADGRHTVRVAKRTEALCGRVALGGVEVHGRMLEPPPEAAKKLLFVGGSVTCGWGVMDNDPDVAFRSGSESGTASYAAEAAKRLGADYASVCVSGRGLLWNWDRKTRGRLPEVWKNGTLQASSQQATDPSPDAVILELGMLELQDGEPEQASFTRAYVDFVMDIHRRWPNAWIVALDAPALDDEKLATLRGFLIPVDQWVRSRYKVKNFSRLFLTQQGTLGYGGGGHPNRDQSVMNGEELADHLRSKIGSTLARKQ